MNSHRARNYGSDAALVAGNRGFPVLTCVTEKAATAPSVAPSQFGSKGLACGAAKAGFGGQEADGLLRFASSRRFRSGPRGHSSRGCAALVVPGTLLTDTSPPSKTPPNGGVVLGGDGRIARFARPSAVAAGPPSAGPRVSFARLRRARRTGDAPHRRITTKQNAPEWGRCAWRRRTDSNRRCTFLRACSLSRGVPSTTRPRLRCC